jgi:hypothetical protein
MGESHPIARRALFGTAGDLLSKYASREIFGATSSFIGRENPFRRPVRPQDIPDLDFTKRLDSSQFLCAAALTGQRLLCNIYEADLLFLPEQLTPEIMEDFKSFYAEDTKIEGELARPALEEQLFGFLREAIDISGDWSTEAMDAYFRDVLGQANQGPSAVGEAILAANDPQAAARLFLVQLASDFLCEASAMARNVLGNFGLPQSELFKILIDEYGYGVHSEKHSTLFEETLKSCGLESWAHAYWQFYLGSSLALVNYFHLVARNHSRFFRYVGALLYTEATLSYANMTQSRILRQVLGEAIDTRYFDEHAHIDRHHGRMVREKIIANLLARYGTQVIPDIVRGFEEFRLLQSLADRDLIAQIAFADSLEEYKAIGTRRAAEKALWERPGVLGFAEAKDELSVTHVHDADELFRVVEGALEFVAGHEHAIVLKAGEAIVIPAGRLHGTRIVSDRCRYEVRAMTGTTA